VTDAVISQPARPRRALIIKPSSLGDVVTALPVLRALRRTHPDVHIAWLVSTTCADILRDEPGIDELIYFERKKLGRAWYSPTAMISLLSFRRKLKAGQFDWVIDLQGLARSGIFTRWTGAAVRAGFADAREGAGAFYNYRIAVEAKHTVDRSIGLARALGLDASGLLRLGGEVHSPSGGGPRDNPDRPDPHRTHRPVSQRPSSSSQCALPGMPEKTMHPHYMHAVNQPKRSDRRNNGNVGY